MNKFKAIIFDMDGVLVDTENFYYNRRKDFLTSKGINIDHLPQKSFIGGNMKNTWESILRDDYHKWDVEKLQEEYNNYKNTHPLPYKELIFPDVEKTLKFLTESGYVLGLASSSSRKDIEAMLTENNLQKYFSTVLSGQEFRESKPNPEIYQQAMKNLGVMPSQVLIIEDSEKGIEAGVASGAQVWAVEDKRFDMDQSKANKLIEGISSLISEI